MATFLTRADEVGYMVTAEEQVNGKTYRTHFDVRLGNADCWRVRCPDAFSGDSLVRADTPEQAAARLLEVLEAARQAGKQPWEADFSSLEQ